MDSGTPGVVADATDAALIAEREALVQERLVRLMQIGKNGDAQKIERELCKRDFEHWVRYWVWTYDPRLASVGNSAHLPFLMFPRQVEMCQFIDAKLEAREDGLIEKSRDIGFTWVMAAKAVHKWIFVDGFKTTFGSRKEDLVDKRGELDSIFEKMRYLIRQLPSWLVPVGFDFDRHDNHMRLINPANGNTIAGEAGEDLGRGGRSTMFVIDEAAFLSNGDSVDAATSGNCDVRIWGSSVKGMGNIFAKKRHGGSLRPDQIFTFHYSSDPRKTAEWAAKKKRSLEEHIWASEYDLDYSASIEGICIPSKWVKASIELAKIYPFAPKQNGIAGLDVGAGGKGKSVFVARFGPMILPPISWGNPDTSETAYRAMEEAQKIVIPRGNGFDNRVTIVAYDSPGVGKGVQSVLRNVDTRVMSTVPVNTSDSPSDVEWPDGETSETKFLNLRAEVWWTLRARFKASYELWLLMTGQAEGQPHPISDCILLPALETGSDTQAMVSQVSLPKWYRNDKGKIVIESKKAMAERGLPSPDHADALALTCLPNPDPLEVWRKIGTYGS